MSIFESKGSLLWQHNTGPCFLTSNLTRSLLPLFTGLFNPFAFNVIGMVGFMSNILLFASYVSHVFFVPLWLLQCFFLRWVNVSNVTVNFFTDVHCTVLSYFLNGFSGAYHMHLVRIDFRFIVFILFLRQRETEHERGRGRKRGRHRIRSRLRAPSCQHRAPELELTSPEIMTWAGVGHLTDWATQAPLRFLTLMINSFQHCKVIR